MARLGNEIAKGALRRHARILLLTAAVILLVGTILPLFDVSRWSGPAQRDLEEMLGRKISYEAAHLSFLSGGPGITLENVTILDDARYGPEPFAFVPTLELRLRPDKLLLGQIRLSSLRLIEPSLNFVRRPDGSWNVVDLVRRIGGPRRAPFNLFPVLSVEGARIDFKIGQRKTTFYILESDLTVYPQESGKLLFQFTGSPARTDRAGNGFGHLSGRVYWILGGQAGGDRMQADLSLEPSNLSEIATLFQGYDAGVHGTVRTSLSARGPLSNLTVTGSLQLSDLHRWDLIMQSSYSHKDDWSVQFEGQADLISQNLHLHTRPSHDNQLNLALEVGGFLSLPSWTVNAGWQDLPAGDLIPIASKMGLSLPPELAVSGNASGNISLTKAQGLTGAATVTNLEAKLSDSPAIQAAQAEIQLEQDHFHLSPTPLTIQDEAVQASGDFYWMIPRSTVVLSTPHFPVKQAKSLLQRWFGDVASTDLLTDGIIEGQLSYIRDGAADPAWSGKLQVHEGAVLLPGLTRPVSNIDGHVNFDAAELEVPHFTARVGDVQVRGSYRNRFAEVHPERVRLELPSADLTDLQALLAPMLEAQGWLARLKVGHRQIPGWLRNRDLTGDLTITHFLVNSTPLGRLDTHFALAGPILQFPALAVRMPAGALEARGSVRLDRLSPTYNFQAEVKGFAWRNGSIDATGAFLTSGAGDELLRNMRAQGSFSASDLTLNADATLPTVNGEFTFSAPQGWPDLRLLNLKADLGSDTWTGEAGSQSDGTLVFNLEHGGQQRRIVSAFGAEPATPNPVQ